MKTQLFLFAFSFFLLASSCKKDPVEPVSPPASATEYPDYSSLAAGNYWVYQRYTLDTSGTYTPTVVDSCYISGDTVINGNTYFVYHEPYVGGGMMTHFFRDSLQYILDLHRIIFSSSDFNHIIKSGYQIQSPNNDTVSRYESKMIDVGMVVNEAAGTFTTLTFITNFYMYPAYSGGGDIRYIYSRYAKNVGIVQESLPTFVNNPNYEIRHLLRYHVN